MASLKYLIIAVICLSAGVSVCESVARNLTLHANYSLTYEVKGAKIEFVIKAKTAGWVAVGFNEANNTMYGADYFMGYVDGTQGFIGDYHTPNATARSPQLDAVQNWELISATELVSQGVPTTTMTISRDLVTTDTSGQDYQIRNTTYNLLWSYNANTDDRSQIHSERGVVLVNLLLEGDPIITTTTTTTTVATTTAGAGIISVGVSTFLMALVASIMKS